MILNKPPTYFIDIDGTILYHHGSLSEIITNVPKALPGAPEKLREMKSKGMVVLTSARPEELRSVTEGHLKECDCVYDILLLGVTKGERYVINDTKPDHDGQTAFGVTIDRNVGIGNLEI